MSTREPIDELGVKATVARLLGGVRKLDTDQYHEYSIMSHHPTAAQEIARIEKIVDGNPHHPLRYDLAFFEAALDPRVIAYKFWIGDESIF